MSNSSQNQQTTANSRGEVGNAQIPANTDSSQSTGSSSLRSRLTGLYYRDRVSSNVDAFRPPDEYKDHEEDQGNDSGKGDLKTHREQKMQDPLTSAKGIPTEVLPESSGRILGILSGLGFSGGGQVGNSSSNSKGAPLESTGGSSSSIDSKSRVFGFGEVWKRVARPKREGSENEKVAGGNDNDGSGGGRVNRVIGRTFLESYKEEMRDEISGV